MNQVARGMFVTVTFLAPYKLRYNDPICALY
jgi:hypothetical protein